MRRTAGHVRAQIVRQRRLKTTRASGAWVADRSVELDAESMLAPGSRVAHHASLRASRLDQYSSVGRYSKLAFVDAGKYCSIAWDCTVGAIGHPLDHVSSHAFPYAPEAGGFVTERRQHVERTTLGADVWIGANAVIMPGVTIGHGAVVAASAVVTRDIKPYAIMGGIPARPIGERFDPHIAARLMELAWWDWPRQRICENIHLFSRPVDITVLAELETLANS